MIAKLANFICIAWFIALLIAGFMAYMMTTSNPHTDVTCDGLGRELTLSPWVMRLMFGQERLWAGWGWFIGDMVIFWGSLAAIGAIYSAADRHRKD